MAGAVVDLVFIINGSPTSLTESTSMLLGTAMGDALALSGNTSRPVQDWQCRDANGVLLETQRVLSDFQFADGTRLFLSLAVGAGG